MRLFPHFFTAITLWSALACNQSQKSTETVQVRTELSGDKNYLSMKIDGVEWSADHNIFGSFHFNESLGPGLINIAGVKGDPPNDQAFNINLYNTTGSGSYVVDIPQGAQPKMYENVCQLTQLTPSNYLCGGLQQQGQMNINIKKYSKEPQMIEATFNGTISCVEGNKIAITEGKFYYNEQND